MPIDVPAFVVAESSTASGGRLSTLTVTVAVAVRPPTSLMV